jgi:hypothetical protein
VFSGSSKFEGTKMARKHVTRTSSLSSAEKSVKDIRRAIRKHYGAEEKIRIILEGLRRADYCVDSLRCACTIERSAFGT